MELSKKVLAASTSVFAVVAWAAPAWAPEDIVTLPGPSVLGLVALGIIGAIVLALGYEIMVSWMETDELNNPRQPAEEAEAG